MLSSAAPTLHVTYKQENEKSKLELAVTTDLKVISSRVSFVSAGSGSFIFSQCFTAVGFLGHGGILWRSQ